MRNTSVAFKDAINAPARDIRALVEMKLGNITPTTATATTTWNSDYAVTKLLDGFTKPQEYSCSGDLTYTLPQGWRSGVKSQADSTFTTPQVVEMLWDTFQPLNNIWFRSTLSGFPVDFDIEIRDAVGNWTLFAAVSSHTTPHWYASTQAGATGIRIVIRKVSAPDANAYLMAFGPVNKVFFDHDDIETLELLREANTETANPVGTSSADELTLVLKNEGGWFSNGNNDSPFAGLLKARVEMIAYLGIVLTNSIEYIKQGTFYLDDWDAPSNALSANLYAYDRLKGLFEVPTPRMAPIRMGSVKTLYEKLFTLAGVPLTDLEVDATLSDTVLPIAWFPEGKLGDTLQKLGEGTFCSIYTTADNRIRVKDNNAVGVSVATFTDSNQINVLTNPHKMAQTFSKVQVTYKTPYTRGQEVLAEIEDIELISGTVRVNNIPFNKPVAHISMIKTPDNGGFFDVMKVDTGTFDTSLELISNATAKVALMLYGRPILQDGATIEVEDAALMATWPNKVFAFESDFLQSRYLAEAFADKLLSFVSNPSAFYNMAIRGDFSIEVMDVITVKSSKHLATSVDVDLLVMRQRIFYDGSLEAEMLLRKA